MYLTMLISTLYDSEKVRRHAPLVGFNTTGRENNRRNNRNNGLVLKTLEVDESESK